MLLTLKRMFSRKSLRKSHGRSQILCNPLGTSCTSTAVDVACVIGRRSNLDPPHLRIPAPTLSYGVARQSWRYTDTPVSVPTTSGNKFTAFTFHRVFLLPALVLPLVLTAVVS